MKYRIMKISPLKAAISVTAIRLIGVSVSVAVALYTRFNGEMAMHDGPKVEPFHFYYDAVAPILSDSLAIFASTFVAIFIFNKICHYWGGIEIELKGLAASSNLTDN